MKGIIKHDQQNQTNIDLFGHEGTKSGQHDAAHSKPHPDNVHQSPQHLVQLQLIFG